jgi:hypothetical protein
MIDDPATNTKMFTGKGLKSKKGKGLAGKSKKEIINDLYRNNIKFGFGVTPTDDKNKKVYGKYYIDLKNLRKNILAVKYVKTNNVVQKMKAQIITNDVKNMIKDIIITGTYDKIKFSKIDAKNKRIIINLSKYMDIEIEDETDDFQTNFQIILGEVESGNNSPIVIRKLKQYILQAINEGRITKNHGYSLLVEYSL